MRPPLRKSPSRRDKNPFELICLQRWTAGVALVPTLEKAITNARDRERPAAARRWRTAIFEFEERRAAALFRGARHRCAPDQSSETLRDDAGLPETSQNGLRQVLRLLRRVVKHYAAAAAAAGAPLDGDGAESPAMLAHYPRGRRAERSRSAKSCQTSIETGGLSPQAGRVVQTPQGRLRRRRER